MRRWIGVLSIVAAAVVAPSAIGSGSVGAVDRLNIADGPCAESTSTPRSSAIVPRPGGGYVVGGSFGFVGAQTGTAALVDASSGTVERSFSSFLGRVEVVLSDGNGGWYVAGSLSTVDGVSTTGVAHIGADRRLDTAFTATANGTVRALALSGATLYLGGSFSTVNGTARKGLAAVDASTGVLTAFDPVVTTVAAAGTVRSLVVEGTTVYVGGSFTNAGGSARANIAAVDAVTGLATSWDPGMSDTVNAMVAADGVLYVGGAFSQVGGSSNRARAAAFDLATGGLTAWNPNIGGTTISALDVEGSTVYAGGSFTLVNGGNAARSNAAAFSTATGAATTWNPSPNAEVLTVDATSTAVYLGGSFTTVGSLERKRAAAVDTDAGASLAWNPVAGTTVTDIAVVGGSAVVAGEFNCVNLVTRNGLAAIDRSGRLTSWDPSPNVGASITVFELVGGDLYVGGTFTSLGGTAHEALGRLDLATGTVDSWDPGLVSGAIVNDVAVSGDSVFLVGVFASVAGTSRNNAAAVSASTGSLLAWDPQLDVAFTVAANWQPGRALAIVDGLVYVGGDFTQVTGGATRRGIAVFDTAGTLQATDIPTNNAVTSFDVSGSTLYVGGVFSTVLGTTRQRAAAIDLTTASLLAWNPSPNSTVTGLAVDGSIVYLAGSFTSVGNVGVGGIVSRTGLGAVDATVGTVSSWNPSATTGSGVSVVVDGQRVYAAGNLVQARRHVLHLGNRSAIALFGSAETTTVGSATSSAAAVTTATEGDTVSDVATVTSFDGSTDPTGTVTFFACSGATPPTSCDESTGTAIGGPVALVAGTSGDGESTATLLGWEPVEGYHLVHAVFSGSSVHEASNGAGTDSVVHVSAAVVTTIPTTTTSQVGAATYPWMIDVTDVATVASQDGVTDPTGSVTFYVCSSLVSPPASCDDTTGTSVGAPVTLDAGSPLDGVATATLTGWTPPVGHHLIHAVYTGSATHDQSAGTGSDDAFEVTQREASVVYNGALTANGAFNLSARVFPAACRTDVAAIGFSADLDADGSYETHIGDAPVRPTGVAGLRWNPGTGVRDIEVRISGDQCTAATTHAVVVVTQGDESGTASVVNNGSPARRLGVSYRSTGARTVTGTASWAADGLSRVTGSLTRSTAVSCTGPDVGSTCRVLTGTGTVYTWNATSGLWEQSAAGVTIAVTLADGDGARADRFRLRVTNAIVAGQVTGLLPAHRGDVAIA